MDRIVDDKGDKIAEFAYPASMGNRPVTRAYAKKQSLTISCGPARKTPVRTVPEPLIKSTPTRQSTPLIPVANQRTEQKMIYYAESLSLVNILMFSVSYKSQSVLYVTCTCTGGRWDTV